MNAKFLYRVKNQDGKIADLIYSYKGYEYMITDYKWYGFGSISESLKYQHEEEQKRIDKIIDARNKQKQDIKNNENIIDKVYKMMEWEDLKI